MGERSQDLCCLKKFSMKTANLFRIVRRIYLYETLLYDHSRGLFDKGEYILNNMYINK